MIVAMQESATDEQIQQVVEHLVRMGFSVHRTTGERQTVLAAVGARVDFDTRNLEVLSGVEHVHRISAPYKLAGRSFRPQGTIVEFANGVQIGGDQVVVMAGPCSVESKEQLFTVAEQVAKAGARVLRGGAFKPRSSPYSFQGMGEEGLKLLRQAGDHFNMLVISEVMEISQIGLMLPYIDIFQVGARNMQNFNLLRELGKVKKPVLLKRGIAATLEELLLSAEYIMAGGNYDVILVRARHSHFRDLYPQHAGCFGHSDHQEALASAHDVRSFAWYGIARQGAAHGTGIAGRRRGRPADRSAPRSGQGIFRRRAVALSRPVRQTDGRAAHDRASGGT